MTNRDWEKFGEDIRKTVQEAIDSQDFHKLNQTITDTVNRAADSVARNFRDLNQRQAGSGNRYTYYGSLGRERAFTQPKEDGGPESFSQPQYGEQRKLPVLYNKITGTKVGGVVLTAVGFSLGGIFTVVFLIVMVCMLLFGTFSVFQIFGISLLLAVMLIGYGMGGYGVRIRGRVKRFRMYLQILGRREYCNIRELADKTHKDIKYVARDLEKMISSGWFLQGHLDKQRTCLIVSHRMYEQYLKVENDRQKYESEKKDIEAQREREQELRRKQDGNEKTSTSRLPSEVRKVIESGDDYIRQIHMCNDAIAGAEISNKISRIEMVVDKIFDRVEQNPESVDDIRKLMEYYLPATVKLLKAYQELDAQPVDGENIRSSKAEIEATLDTLNAAFEKLLDNLFQDTAWDVSTDISVLQTMLAQEGLTEDILKK